ncbi:hypothetical protein EASAB2608_08298 [Streptomyces sp. EAS-AB2608]|uniref:Uncharacterized protein n=1 Tax=Streptomyces bangladeshensis TaxID=295352 RepID=A0ABN1ZK68_9ACTN|nr:hypothetical protein EASAB2608_08298 [Streptomyces sp. EAS-AB2608]
MQTVAVHEIGMTKALIVRIPTLILLRHVGLPRLPGERERTSGLTQPNQGPPRGIERTQSPTWLLPAGNGT